MQDESIFLACQPVKTCARFRTPRHQGISAALDAENYRQVQYGKQVIEIDEDSTANVVRAPDLSYGFQS